MLKIRLMIKLEIIQYYIIVMIYDAYFEILICIFLSLPNCDAFFNIWCITN